MHNCGISQHEADAAIASQPNDIQCLDAERSTGLVLSLTWATALLQALGVLVFPLVSWPQATAVREADATCGECHSEIYRKYLATPMANASGPAMENLQAGSFVHKASGVEYRIAAQDGKAVLSYRVPNESEDWNERPLSYFLGSGHLGITYLYSIGDYLFETPVAWYATLHGYDMKPGLAEMGEKPPPLPMQSSCLRCHMSGVRASDPGTINHYSGPAFLHTGITCEACHGDSRKHQLSKGRAAIVNPARLDADRRDSVCISCHLEGDVSVERAGQAALNYRPGESISRYLAYYVKTGTNLTARGVSEVEQLGQSTCKRASGDKMSCTSCHDPHFTPNEESSSAFFRGKCLACHNEPKFAATHHPENQDCTSCHMRRTGAANILHVAWTDHRILRIPDDQRTAQPKEEESELKPIFSPEATERDLAMAYNQALLAGDRGYEATAWKLLNRQRELIASDKEALDALGNLSAERGENETAKSAFQSVLELDPNDLTALSNLGILKAKEGDFQDAILMMRKAFDLNRDIPGLAMNLARVECIAGDGAAARTTLSTALAFSEDLEEIRRLSSQMTNCGEVRGK